MAASKSHTAPLHTEPSFTGFLPPTSPHIAPTIGVASNQVPRHSFHVPAPAYNPQIQYWSMETSPDEHVRMLLAHHYGSPKSLYDDTMIFAHWHSDGDNFMGYVENVRFDVRHPGIIKRITYDIAFNDPASTLDDIFAGEGIITLRNDLDVKHMNLVGE
jgi:hypothetical protein